MLKDIGVSILTNVRLDNRPCESRYHITWYHITWYHITWYHITWDRLGYLTTTTTAAILFMTDAMTTLAPTVKGQGQAPKN